MTVHGFGNGLDTLSRKQSCGCARQLTVALITTFLLAKAAEKRDWEKKTLIIHDEIVGNATSNVLTNSLHTLSAVSVLQLRYI